MNEPRDERIDALLNSSLSHETLEDDIFTRGVIDLIDRRTRQRRAMLAVAWVCAAAIGLAILPTALASLTSITPASVAAMMVLCAISSLVWTATAD
jgi:hypothetical protein